MKFFKFTSLLTMSLLCSSTQALDNFDQSYISIGIGFGAQNYALSSNNQLFNKYKQNFSLGWGHYFTDTTSYEIQYNSSKGQKNKLARLASSDFMGVPLNEDLTVDTDSTMTQFSTVIKQLFGFSDSPYGKTALIGVAGLSRGSMKHEVGVGEENNNLTPFKVRHSSFYPSLGLGLYLQPMRSSLFFSSIFMIHQTNRLGRTTKEFKDSSGTTLGIGTLAPKNTASLDISVHYLF